MNNQIKNWLASPYRFQRFRDLILSEIWFRLPLPLRKQLFKGYTFFCPVCQTKLSSFLSLRRSYYLECPICRSMQRHRLVMLFLQNQTNLFEGKQRSFLHFAPEPGISNRIQNIPEINYISADLNDPKAQQKIDITNIEFPDKSFNAIYCSHVLEHVSDDCQALREIFRVLKPEGWALILVPIIGKHTLEDASIVLPTEREKVFGQFDHVRRYGFDFSDRLKEVGFEVSVFTASDLVNESEISYNGLSIQDYLYYCKKL